MSTSVVTGTEASSDGVPVIKIGLNDPLNKSIVMSASKYSINHQSKELLVNDVKSKHSRKVKSF